MVIIRTKEARMEETSRVSCDSTRNDAGEKLPGHWETSIYPLVRLNRFRFYSLLFGVADNSSAVELCVKGMQLSFMDTHPIHRLSHQTYEPQENPFFFMDIFNGDGWKRAQNLVLKFIRLPGDL